MTESDIPATPFHDLDAYVDLPRGVGAGALARRHPAGHRRADAEPEAHEVRHRAVGGRPDRRAPGAPAHPQRQGRGRRGVPARRVAAVRLRAPRPGDRRRRGRRLGAVAAAGRGWRGARRRLPARRRRRRPGRGRRRHVVLAAGTFPSSTDEESEKDKRKERKEKKVSAILHESVPVRFWDHDLGPDAPRLFAGSLATDGDDPGIELTDLTPDARPRAGRGPVRRVARRLDRRHHLGRRPSAAASASRWRSSTSRPGSGGCCSTTRRASTTHPRFSPDGSQLALVVEKRSTPHRPRRPPARRGLRRRRDAPRPLRRLGPLAAGSRSGRRTGRRWCCTPTRTAGRRCSGSTSRPASSPG